MEIREVLDIMNSDFKLWEQATSEDLDGGRVAKTIILPWGIGEYRIVLEGMTNADTRRGAVSAYGDHIRGLIDDRINDQAITSRAQVAASKAEPIDSGDSDGSSGGLGVRDTGVPTPDDEEAEEAHDEDASRPSNWGDDIATQRAQVEGEIDRHTIELSRLLRQLRGIDAAIAAMKDMDDE